MRLPSFLLALIFAVVSAGLCAQESAAENGSGASQESAGEAANVPGENAPAADGGTGDEDESAYYDDEDYEDDEDEAGPGIIDTDWAKMANAYSMGDQVFNISLALVLPLFIVDQNEGHYKSPIKLGGMGALGWNYFFGPHFFIGAELSGMFAATTAKNMYFMIPIGFRAGYQFVLRKFEFPLALLVGIAPQSYQDRSYLGLFVKPTAGVYYRFHPEWSLGVSTGFWWVPQWTKKNRPNYNGNVNIHGFFMDFSIGVRYHF